MRRLACGGCAGVRCMRGRCELTDALLQVVNRALSVQRDGLTPELELRLGTRKDGAFTAGAHHSAFSLFRSGAFAASYDAPADGIEKGVRITAPRYVRTEHDCVDYLGQGVRRITTDGGAVRYERKRRITSFLAHCGAVAVRIALAIEEPLKGHEVERVASMPIRFSRQRCRDSFSLPGADGDDDPPYVLDLTSVDAGVAQLLQSFEVELEATPALLRYEPRDAVLSLQHKVTDLMAYIDSAVTLSGVKVQKDQRANEPRAELLWQNKMQATAQAKETSPSSRSAATAESSAWPHALCAAASGQKKDVGHLETRGSSARPATGVSPLRPLPHPKPLPLPPLFLPGRQLTQTEKKTAKQKPKRPVAPLGASPWAIAAQSKFSATHDKCDRPPVSPLQAAVPSDGAVAAAKAPAARAQLQSPLNMERPIAPLPRPLPRPHPQGYRREPPPYQASSPQSASSPPCPPHAPRAPHAQRDARSSEQNASSEASVGGSVRQKRLRTHIAHRTPASSLALGPPRRQKKHWQANSQGEKAVVWGEDATRGCDAMLPPVDAAASKRAAELAAADVNEANYLASLGLS